MVLRRTFAGIFLFLFAVTSIMPVKAMESVFEPPMIYGVYEDVIPAFEPGSQEAQKEAREPVQILNQVQDDNSNGIPSENVILCDSEGSQMPVISTVAEHNGEIPLARRSGTATKNGLNRQTPLNPFDILLSIGKIQNSAFKYKDAILELKEDLWHPPKDPSVITEKYWNSLTEKQQKELHYYRNNYQGDLPYNILWPKSEFPFIGKWKCIWEPVTHNLNGATGNQDCRGLWQNGHKQAIYDKEGILVTTPDNMGTYDFALPFPFIFDHVTMDIGPWIEWGNSPDDPTTKEERMLALDSSRATRWMLSYLGYDLSLINK